MDTNMTPPQGLFVPFFGTPCLHRLRPRPRRAQDRGRCPPRLSALGGVRAPVRPPLRTPTRPRLAPATPRPTPLANTARFTACIEDGFADTPRSGSGCTAAGRPAPKARRASTDEHQDPDIPRTRRPYRSTSCRVSIRRAPPRPALGDATPDSVVFAQDDLALERAIQSRAGAILARHGDFQTDDPRVLWVRDPRFAMALAGKAFAAKATRPWSIPAP